jgi:O-acetylhomoserine (thiol)-lyase
VPIYQTTSYVFDSAEHAASLFNLQTFGNVYSRLSNPTVAVIEERIAALEGGRAAIATASGMAAEMVAMLTLCRQGDHIVAANTLYGGTYSQFSVTFARFGIELHLRRTRRSRKLPPCAAPEHQGGVRRDDRQPATERARHRGGGGDRPRTRRAAGGRQHAGLALPVPADRHGADIVVHSVTKYLGGHGTTMGGVVVESGRFPWDNGKFPGDGRAVARAITACASTRPSATSASR